MYREAIWADTNASPKHHLFPLPSLSLLLQPPFFPFQPLLWGAESHLHTTDDSSTYFGAYTTLKTDFLVLKLSETVRLFRAEVRPAPSHCLSAGACDKGQHRSCWKAAGSPTAHFEFHCSSSRESRPPKSLMQGCWGAEATCATCGNTPTYSRLRWSTLTNSNFQRSFTTA